MTKTDILIARATKRYITRYPLLRKCRHSELSIICSADDDAGPNQFLFDLSLKTIKDAASNDLQILAERNSALADSVYYNVFPGEHYRLLASLVRILEPRGVIEVGTFTGMSSAAMLSAMKDTSSLSTFDINSWRNHRSHLSERDFNSGKIKQVLGDLSDPAVFDQYMPLFEAAQLIFCDAPKDGIFEHKFLSNLTRVKPMSPTLLVLDDTRQLNMIDVWRSIQSPKLDLTSFGHWSGTGLVDISLGLRMKA